MCCRLSAEIIRGHGNLVSDHAETELEMARRHVREGEERLARQAAMVAALEGANHIAAAALGRQLLETIRSSLGATKRHLQQIEGRSRRDQR